MVKERDITEYLTKTAILERTGWTQKAITLFLGEPDKENINPFYKKSATVKLYKLEKVLLVETTESFKDFIEKNIKRLECCKKAVETKKDKILRYVEDLEIVIPKINKDILLKNSIEHYNWRKSDWFYNRGGDRFSEGYQEAALKSDKEFLNRITLNYLRHNLTEYEEELYNIFGKVGTNDAYILLKDKINTAILEKYNWLN